MTAPEFLRASSDEGIPGVAVGIVTDNEDPEKMGRVKLTFPWRDTDDESFWARIATPMAGGGRGTYFLPEIDDEVLVAFENGDIHYPYVVGSLWNGVDLPPQENADGKNDVRQIRSRSGHEVTFDDAESGGGLRLTTAGGHSIALSDESDSATVSITDSGGNEIVIDADGAVTISGASSVSVTANELELSGTKSVTITSSGELTLTGTPIKLN